MGSKNPRRRDEPRLFVARKPMFVGSNTFLGRLKRRYGVKKAGFSGTLDPFACGVLVVAFGPYTKLFRYLRKSPKTYCATLWLGARSSTLDIEGIERIDTVAEMDERAVKEAVESFRGEFVYTPPAFSAKKVAGRRAYDLAREGKTVALEPVASRIHRIRLLHYRHPFITFEAEVAEGTYIRSLAESIAEKLGIVGSLSYLERLNEGVLHYEGEKAVDPLDVLSTVPNRYLGEGEDLALGKKLTASRFENPEPGLYHVVFEPFFAIIEIDNHGRVHYRLNKVPLCSC